MRVTTAFNKLLGLNATFVQAVNFEPDQIIVTVRLARQRLREAGFQVAADPQPVNSTSPGCG